MTENTFSIEMEVRDYECDMEGIVNNAVYMNYLEHARHGFLRSKGMTFAGLIEQGIQLVVTRIESDFLYPLRSGDKFRVTASVERVSKIRFGFKQEILRLPDEKPVLKARVIGTSLDSVNKPRYFDELEKLY